MSEHKLKEGKQFITALLELGRVLGYHAQGEMPIEKKRRNPQAVDVAWLHEANQEYPLMIFEIESRISNTVSNNPVKIFGKANESFEKPLFFFHVMMTGGEDTSRIEDLRRTFGTHNYRVYNLAQGEATQLALDILTQHRRLECSIDVPTLVATLSSDAWSTVDVISLLVHVERLNFRSDYLHEYATLALGPGRARYLPHFLRYLKSRVAESGRSHGLYLSYIGSDWSPPVHHGILASMSPASEKEQYFQKTRQWQERELDAPDAVPDFGPMGNYERLARVKDGHYFPKMICAVPPSMSNTYSVFIVGTAAPLWALVAVLMRELPQAVRYAGEQIKGILEQCDLLEHPGSSSDKSVTFFPALWLIHVAAACPDHNADLFDFARTHVNSFGGVSRKALYLPPGHHRKGSEELEVFSSPELVPPMEVFCARLDEIYASNRTDSFPDVTVALKVLTDDDAIFQWQNELVPLLSRNRSLNKLRS